MKHTLSPVFEYALVIVVASYGFLAIYLASLQPLAVSTFSPAVSLPQPVSLDTGLWTRWDDTTFGYAFGAPPGWVVDLGDPSAVLIGRSAGERARAPEEGEAIQVRTVALTADRRIEDLAAADFDGMRPALYDVTVDGRPGIFAVAFKGNRIRRQAVYVLDGEKALVIRAAATEPAVFAAFVTTVKFYVPDIPKQAKP